MELSHQHIQHWHKVQILLGGTDHILFIFTVNLIFVVSLLLQSEENEFLVSFCNKHKVICTEKLLMFIFPFPLQITFNKPFRCDHNLDLCKRYNKRIVDRNNQRNKNLGGKTDHILSFFHLFLSVLWKASKFCGHPCRL